MFLSLPYFMNNEACVSSKHTFPQNCDTTVDSALSSKDSLGDGLCKQGLAAAGRPEHHDVGLLQLQLMARGLEDVGAVAPGRRRRGPRAGARGRRVLGTRGGRAGAAGVGAAGVEANSQSRSHAGNVKQVPRKQ